MKLTFVKATHVKGQGSVHLSVKGIQNDNIKINYVNNGNKKPLHTPPGNQTTKIKQETKKKKTQIKYRHDKTTAHSQKSG